MNRSLLAVAVLACAACHSAPSSSPAAARPAFEPIAGNDALLVWSAGASATLASELDARLAEAIRAAPRRASELATELEDPSFPSEAAELALETVASPWELRASIDTSNPAEMPFRAQLSARADDPRSAHERATTFTRLITAAGVPSLGVNQAMHGLVQVPLEGMNVFHGIAQDGDPSTWRIALGAPELEARALGTLDLPEGSTPFFAFKIDFRAIENGLAAVEPEVAATFGQSVAGQGDAIQGGFAHRGGRIVGGIRVRGWEAAQEDAGLEIARPISREDLELVPGDVAWAAVGTANARAGFAMLRKTLADGAAQADLGEGSDPIAMLSALAGFDVEGDLVATLGDAWGVYRSDAGGGAGWLSTVAFVRVDDQERLARTLDELEAHIAELSMQFARGYVAVRPVTLAGVEARVLAFPGLPVPLELSWALAHGAWWFAATPQALEAALAHAALVADAQPGTSSSAARKRLDRTGTLLDSAALEGLSSGDLESLYALSVLDVERYARDGYAATAAFGSALSNGLSSPSDTERAPTLLVPGFDELVIGAGTAVSLTRLVDGDLVTTTSSHGSMLVNVAATLGWLGELPWVFGGLGALAAAQSMGATEVFGMDVATLPGADPMDGMEGMDEGMGMTEEEIEALIDSVTPPETPPDAPSPDEPAPKDEVTPDGDPK